MISATGSMSALVKVVGCRPMTIVPRAAGAGVRTPPGEETAGEGPVGPRARKPWGFESCGLSGGAGTNRGEWTNRSSAMVEGVCVHERSVSQCVGRVELPRSVHRLRCMRCQRLTDGAKPWLSADASVDETVVTDGSIAGLEASGGLLGTNQTVRRFDFGCRRGEISNPECSRIDGRRNVHRCDGATGRAGRAVPKRCRPSIPASPVVGHQSADRCKGLASRGIIMNPAVARRLALQDRVVGIGNDHYQPIGLGTITRITAHTVEV